MALIDGEYYYRPPAKKTVAKKVLAKPVPAKQQYYTRPPDSESTKRATPPVVRKPAIYEDDAVNYGLPGWTMPGTSPAGAPPPGTRPTTQISKKSQWFQDKTPTTTASMPTRRTTIYEDDAANYGLPGWTAPGMRPAGVPTPPAVQAGNNPLIIKLPTRRQPIAPVRRPAMSDIYEDDAVNYGLPGYTALGNSPTGAPPPGTRPYYSGTSGVAGKPVVASPWISNVTPPLTDWQYYRQGFPIAKQVPDSIVPGTPSFDAWRKAYPMAQLPDPAAPWKHNVTRMPGTPVTNAVQTKAPYQLPQWHPYQYRGEFDPYEMGGSPYKITDPFNFPPMTMEELMASGADPWAFDPYDTAGNPYRMEGDGSGMSSGGGGWGDGGYGWGDGGWGGGGGGGSYGASSGVSSYLPGAGGGYGARASAPNYTGRGAGRGSSYAGSESYNTPQWRMPMLVWNI
jgi:hypothetical protein